MSEIEKRIDDAIDRVNIQKGEEKPTVIFVGGGSCKQKLIF